MTYTEDSDIHVLQVNAYMKRNIHYIYGGGPGAVEFLGPGFVLMPLHTYHICL